MDISPQGLDLLIQREGKRNDAYQDSVGVWTIGVGHTGPEVHEGLHWTDVQIEEALTKDLQRFEDSVNKHVTVPLEQHAFDALVSFSLNVGTGAFEQSTLLRRLNQADYAGAADAFDMWHIPAEITSRRNGEKAQFMGTNFEPRIP